MCALPKAMKHSSLTLIPSGHRNDEWYPGGPQGHRPNNLASVATPMSSLPTTVVRRLPRPMPVEGWASLLLNPRPPCRSTGRHPSFSSLFGKCDCLRESQHRIVTPDRGQSYPGISGVTVHRGTCGAHLHEVRVFCGGSETTTIFTRAAKAGSTTLTRWHRSLRTSA